MSNAALSQLKDLHLPLPITWWPLAPGWYILLLIILFLIIILSFVIYKRRIDARPKKQALELLQNYKKQYEKEGNTQITSAQISELLRRVALVYYPRKQVAGLDGELWLEFLNQTGNKVDFKTLHEMLLELPYKTSESIDLKPLIVQAERWIKQRRMPCSN